MKGIFAAFLLAVIVLPASAQKSISNIGVPVTESFAGFAGLGFSPTPPVGWVNSNEFSVDGFDDNGSGIDGACPFGHTCPDLSAGEKAATDFSRGVSGGNAELAAGIYAFDRGTDVGLGWQAKANNFEPGNLYVKYRNDTGQTVDVFDVDYEVWYLDSDHGSHKINFAWGSGSCVTPPVSEAYVAVPGHQVITPFGADPTPVWASVAQSISATPVSGVAPGDCFYLRFTGDKKKGGAEQDEMSVDNISVTAASGSGGGNVAPTASFTWSATDLTADLDGSGSTDDGTITSYDWDFGDGSTGSGSTVAHAYAAGGSYSVMLTVTDDGGLTDTDTQTVTVTDSPINEPPTAAFTWSATDLTADLDGSGSTDDGTITTYDWDFGDGSTGSGSTVAHAYAAGGSYSVVLTVTDDGGLTDTDTQTVTVTDPGSGGTGAFLESAGLLSMESENYSSRVDRSGHMWVLSTDEAGYSGTGAMRADPDDGTTVKRGDALISAPELVFDVEIATTGSYYVWLRVFAPNSNANSVHAGKDGSVRAGKMVTDTFGSWVWTNLDMKGKVSSFSLDTVGAHTIHVWMREDGISVDKVVLTTDAAFVPTGLGPDESARATAAPQASTGRTGARVAVASQAELDDKTQLGSAYPNPFVRGTSFDVTLAEEGRARLEVYDMLGRRVAEIVNRDLARGTYRFEWDGQTTAGAAAPGAYVARLTTAGFSQTVVVIRAR